MARYTPLPVRCFPGPPVPTPPPPPMLFPLMAAAASQPRQMVYVFPPLGQLEPSCVRLVTDSADASTAVACLLGFFRAVCRDGYRLVLEASEREGVWLVEVPVGPEYLRRKLRSLRPSGGEPDSSPTMDDFYLLLGVMLCNLPRVRGSNLSRSCSSSQPLPLMRLHRRQYQRRLTFFANSKQRRITRHTRQNWTHRYLFTGNLRPQRRQLAAYITRTHTPIYWGVTPLGWRTHRHCTYRDWFQNRVNDLVQLFPAVSAPPRVPLYQDDQADAIARFGEQCPLLRAALCRGLLSGRFDGPMLQLQEYVAVGWRFAGMKHVHLILEFLSGRNSWVLDVIPELRARGDRLQAFLQAYHDLGADGPYMKLLHLPEAATTLRKHLGLHVAAAYALAILEDEHWLHYKGVPRDKDEEHVLQKITTIKRMALGAPRPDLDGSGDSGDA